MFATCKFFLAIRSSNPIASLHLRGKRSWNSAAVQFQPSLLQENIGEFGHIFFITEKGGDQKPGCEASGKGSKLKSNNNSREVGSSSSSSWLDIIATHNASFAVHWEVMCGCDGVGVDVDKDG
jgi:hypothetical protein